MKLLSLAMFIVVGLQISVGAREQRLKANLEGTVTRTGSSQPVPRARVTLIRSGGSENLNRSTSGLVGGLSAEPDIAPVITDNQGRFVFQVDEGRYILRVQADGYVPQTFGQRFTEGPGAPVVLTAGQQVRNLNVSLTAAATVSGRVRDETDRPLANVPVQLLQYSYDENGERSYRTGLSAVRTNDRGEYRIYWATPGRYYVLAGRPTTGPNPMFEMMSVVLGGGNSSGSRVPTVTGHAFYPGVTDVRNARPVDLQPGADLQSIDVTLQARPRTHTIRGKLVDSGTGQPPAQATVFIESQTPGLIGNNIESQLATSNHNYDATTGAFQIRDLFPGPYTVMAISDNPLAATGTGSPIHSTGMLVVSVSNADVDDVVISVTPAASISGRLRVEGQLPGTATADQLPVVLEPTGTNRVAQQTLQRRMSAEYGSDKNSVMSGDGTFRIDNVIPGDYRLEVRYAEGSLNNFGFIREARFEGSDVLDNPLRFSGTNRGEMDITVVVGGGRIYGTVTDVRSQPLPGTRVVLVPDRARSRVAAYRTVITDSTGRFFIAPVAPGDYKLFAWESIEEFAWFDPDVLARFESRGRGVHITENSNETIDLRIIPADGAR